MVTKTKEISVIVVATKKKYLAMVKTKQISVFSLVSEKTDFGVIGRY